MVRFEITINGETHFGSDDITALTLVAEEISAQDEDRVSLHASAGEGSLQWWLANLKIGDEIAIKIVDAYGEPDKIPMACSFCGRESHEVPGLIAGKKGAICDDCVAAFSGTVTAHAPLPAGAAIHQESSWACDFCGESPDAIPAVIVRNGAAICPECLRACSDLLAGRKENPHSFPVE